MHRLHLLVTGLCPDFGPHAQAAFASLHTPALARLLGRGRPTTLGSSALSQRLARLYGLAPDSDPPLAALGLLADGIDPGESQWWFAEPVHLQLMLDHLRLEGGSALNLDATEAEELVAALNQHFAGEISILAPVPMRWYARFNTPLTATCTPLDAAMGHTVTPLMPGGPDGARLRRAMNEAQMLLHAHPLNQAREARGLPPVNSLWFWGGGRRAAIHSPPVALHADNASARALAFAAGSAFTSLPARFSEIDGNEVEHWIVLDRLHSLACNGRTEAWRETLQEMEAAWFAPTLEALTRGQLDRIKMECLGDTAFGVEASAWDLRKFWKPAHALSRHCHTVSR